MSNGVESILQAAAFIERQEKLKKSPQLAVPTISTDNILYSYENNNNINSLFINDTAVTASAVTAARFQNGVTITPGNGGGLYHQQPSSQLTNGNHRNGSDYEFNNGHNAGGLTTIVSTTAANATSHHNGRSSDGRKPEDGCSSSLSSLPKSLVNASIEQQQQQQQQDSKKAVLLRNLDINNLNNTSNSAAGFTVVDNASKQPMQLNAGIYLGSPASSSIVNSTKIQNSYVPVVKMPFPMHTKVFSSSNFNAPTAVATVVASPNKHKIISPLTPPPMSSRKYIDTNARKRSYSLSHKNVSANHQLLPHNNNTNSSINNGTTHMAIDDAHMGYVAAASSSVVSVGSNSNSSSSNNSPPRHGNHYLQMMSSAQQGNAGSQLSHATPSISGSGRRRTISSNSNGAGTREVHNKLEKNRRAHLKECYESLHSELLLKEEDRKKPSNLAILQEAHKQVQTLKEHDEQLESSLEQYGRSKINLQKKLQSLKRELGPKYEKIFQDIDVGSIPSERETINETGSLSSGRGSMLYSSSSSLSSGGSNGSNTSPVGAGLQTAMPTAISPVISSKINSNNNNNSATSNNNTTVTSPISPLIQQQQFKSSIPFNSTSSPSVAAAAAAATSASITLNSPVGSPNAFLNGIPLSLTAKNISATSLTRGSPTPIPSTPSPSPSSSSGISSSSSLISSSPPMANGVVLNGRNVTVNIPNGLKLQQAAAIGGANGNATATIIATSPPGAPSNAISSNVSSTKTAFKSLSHNRKITNANNSLKSFNKGEQPLKMLKFLNGQAAASVNNSTTSLLEGSSGLASNHSQDLHNIAQLPVGTELNVLSHALNNGTVGTLFQANGKLMLLNTNGNSSCGSNSSTGILLKESFVMSTNTTPTTGASAQILTSVYVGAPSETTVNKEQANLAVGFRKTETIATTNGNKKTWRAGNSRKKSSN